MCILGKGEPHFYFAIQQVGRYKDQLAVSHVQQSLTVKIRLSCISDWQYTFHRHFMMLYAYNRTMYVYGESMAMYVCFFIFFIC